MVIGIILIMLSFGQIFVQKNPAEFLIILLLWFIFGVGLTFISEGILKKFNHSSFIKILFRDHPKIIHFIIACIIGAIVLEGSAQWLGKLWRYPYLNNKNYFILFIPIFLFYWLMITESYLAIRAIIHHFTRLGRLKYKFLSVNIFGLIGPALLVAVFLHIFLSFYRNHNYIFSICCSNGSRIIFFEVLVIFVSFWMVQEYIQFKQGKASLIRELYSGRIVSLCSIIIASTLTAILLEFENIPKLFWRYTNWPIEHIQILHLPIAMFLAWPLHYIMFLSLLNIVLPNKSISIWEESETSLIKE